MREAIRKRCVCCKEMASVLLAQSSFCPGCFTERLEKGFFAEIRKALSHTFRNKVRKVLVVIEKNRLSSEVIQKIINKSDSAMIEYHYCTFSNDENDFCGNNYIRIESKENTHSSRVEALKEYCFNNNYSCVVFSHYSVEVAYEILKMITNGEVVQYTKAFKGDRIVSVCYPFYSVSYKSIAYFSFYSGILTEPFRIKSDIIKEKENQAHMALLRDLLKNSPASILNLIKVQQRVEDL
ncbi:hypothetical protein NEIG_00188 [Nematocida sp. ERTm5]|nr:hypothetical protein NEIRO02_2085 [Nematocida sp. AWRm79]KAI5185757.1 hypothetical protein NEIRO03_2108 [Nematocida sp. AWRm78]OAG30676.1 hypothetical protein NEIG_00188 [Nematocida sp. ERTm5]